MGVIDEFKAVQDDIDIELKLNAMSFEEFRLQHESKPSDFFTIGFNAHKDRYAKFFGFQTYYDIVFEKDFRDICIKNRGLDATCGIYSTMAAYIEYVITRTDKNFLVFVPTQVNMLNYELPSHTSDEVNCLLDYVHQTGLDILDRIYFVWGDIMEV